MHSSAWFVQPFCALILLLGLASMPPKASAAEPEPHAGAILTDLLNLKSSTAKHIDPDRKPWFVTFWDFDGTILAGDSSEGWEKEGQRIYHGLIHRCIEAGHSAIYKGPQGFDEFWTDYMYMDRRSGHWLSYPYIVQMLRGTRRADVEALANQTFQHVLRKYYYASSMKVLRGLQRAGVEVVILTAGPEIFVRGAAATLDIPRENIHGVRTQEENGLLTEKLIYPVTWAEGKTEQLRAVIQSRQNADPRLEPVVLGAFGNSYSTDGPFLAWVARQTLPGGTKPVTVMINGGTPPASYAGLFRCVSQSSYGDNPGH